MPILSKVRASAAAHGAVTFWLAYFIYYSAYALFASYLVSYLTRLGFSATVCGVVASLSLVANISMQPVAGYLTDTFLTTRRYLILCCLILVGCSVAASLLQSSPVAVLAIILFSSLFSYTMSNLMDAWVNGCAQTDAHLVYGAIRSGGSLGFALVSTAGGYLFAARGYGSYFWLQGACFLALILFLAFLPELPLSNRSAPAPGENGTRLGFMQAFGRVFGSKSYCACLVLFGLYWMSHRPIGSYLALICAARGDDSLYGMVCGVGAVVECIMLAAAPLLARRLTLRGQLVLAFVLDVARPALLLLPGVVPLYLGQGVQAVSFALFYIISVECLSRCAVSQIRSFSIASGLTFVSVVGTVGANLLGGALYDRFGALANIVLSLALSLAGVVVCLLLGQIICGTTSKNES